MTLYSGMGPGTGSAHMAGSTSHPFRYPVKHRVYRVPSFQSSPNWVPPQSLTYKRVLLSPLFGFEGGDTLACGVGGGGPNSDKGTDTLVLYVYYNPSTLWSKIFKGRTVFNTVPVTRLTYTFYVLLKAVYIPYTHITIEKASKTNWKPLSYKTNWLFQYY